jgi:hypothetical protein
MEMVMRLMVMVALVCLAGCMAMRAEAQTYTGTPVYSAGTGANTASIAVDFGTSSYVFQYSWDGAATSWDALHGVDLAGDLSVTASIDPQWGAFVSRIRYPGATAYDYGMTATGWTYFVSTNGTDWSSLGQGASFSPLSNGDWNAWVWSNYDENWNIIREPGEEPVPEPLTLAVLGGGVLFIRRKMA